jgi:DNA repair protein RadC
MTMGDLAPHDRPREKLVRSGPDALGDNELLALLLSQGMANRSALQMASAMLADLGGLFGLARASHEQLCRYKGIGETRAGRILAAIELGRRTLRPHGERIVISEPRDVASLLTPDFGARTQEHFGILLLDARHRVRRTRVLSIGSIDGTYVHPREVFSEAVGSGAKAIVLFHNHPSGDPTPSGDDLALTRRLQAAGEIVGIEVLDHVIIASNGYYSFKEATPPPVGMSGVKQKRRV